MRTQKMLQEVSPQVMFSLEVSPCARKHGISLSKKAGKQRSLRPSTTTSEKPEKGTPRNEHDLLWIEQPSVFKALCHLGIKMVLILKLPSHSQVQLLNAWGFGPYPLLGCCMSPPQECCQNTGNKRHAGPSCTVLLLLFFSFFAAAKYNWAS